MVIAKVRLPKPAEEDWILLLKREVKFFIKKVIMLENRVDHTNKSKFFYKSFVSTLVILLNLSRHPEEASAIEGLTVSFLGFL
jgi:hypothetical protein